MLYSPPGEGTQSSADSAAGSDFRSAGHGWILTPGNSASEIRRAFAVFSQSAIRTSQGAMQLGGFGN